VFNCVDKMNNDHKKRKQRSRKSKKKKQESLAGNESVCREECSVPDISRLTVSDTVQKGNGYHAVLNSAPATPVLSLHEYCQMCYEMYTSSAQRATDTEALPICRGFLNVGNSCYVNCVLQSVLSLPRFVRYLRAISTVCPVSSMPPMLAHWKGLMSLLDESLADPDSVIQPRTSSTSVVTGDFSKRLPPVAPGAHMTTTIETFKHQQNTSHGWVSTPKSSYQADAMEFLTHLLDCLHEELHSTDAYYGAGDRASGTTINGHSDSDDGWAEVGKGGCAAKIDHSGRTNARQLNAASPISQTFHGTIRSEVRFSKKKANSVTFQRFHCLTLDFITPYTNSSLGSSVESMLVKYFEEETLSDAKMRKKISIETPPEVLILNLKRFAFDRQKGTTKIQAEVAYPAVLHIPSSCLSVDLANTLEVSRPTPVPTPPSFPVSGSYSALDSQPVNTHKNVNYQHQLAYKLHAVVLHHGPEAAGGHYTSFCLSQGRDNTWRHIDDSVVSRVSANHVLSAKSQVLTTS